MSAADILKMIEKVDPSDTAKLDEIDARVWALLNGFEIDRMDEIGSAWAKPRNIHHSEYPRYTRSRDALKAIRPEGYVSGAFPETKYGDVGECFHGYCQSESHAFETLIDFDALPTEELAELHAILQATEYERKA